MNFVALIGVVENKEIKDDGSHIICLNVENNDKNNEYEKIKIYVEKEKVKQLSEELTTGSIIGVKGKIWNEMNTQIYTDLIQIF